MSSQATGHVNIKTAKIQSVGPSLSALTVNTVSRPRSKMYIRKLTTIAILAVTAAAHLVVPNDDQDMSGLVVNGIPYSTRVKYMRLVLTPSYPFSGIVPNHHQANEALFEQSGPCPFAAYGTIIVNHTSDSVVCRGANFRTGDPTYNLSNSLLSFTS
jgi:hypothetical protein